MESYHRLNSSLSGPLHLWNKKWGFCGGVEGGDADRRRFLLGIRAFGDSDTELFYSRGST
ncbi:dna polymerase lambda [Moniliophthora roreri]|nr:dna polymerase lambda [Moniliophthora roreri]